MRYIAAFLFLTLLATMSSAQITISSDEYFNMAINNSFITKGYGQDNTQRTNGEAVLNALATQSGTNQSWDFSSESYTINGVSIYVPSVFPYPGSAVLANDPDFTTATHVQELNSDSAHNAIIYHFYKFNQSGLWDLGQAWDDSNGTGMKRKIIAYNPPKTIMKFPVTYGTSWQEVLNVKNVFLNGGTEIDSVSAAIDGWGSLTTPTKSHGKDGGLPMALNQALRLKTTTIQTTTASNNSVTKTTIVAYQWITKTGYSANFGYQNGAALPYYSGYTSAVPSSVTDDASASNQLHLRISSNPVVTSQTKIFFTLVNESKVNVKIIDALGRDMLSFETNNGGAGQNEIPLDLSTFSNGTYFVYVSAADMTSTGKLVVSK